MIVLSAGARRYTLPEFLHRNIPRQNMAHSTAASRRHARQRRFFQQGWFLVADARIYRRRLWRYRYKSPVRAARGRAGEYVLILLRADNKGEGGTLALMALASRSLVRRGGLVILLGIISGALFYGDAIITPALSVCSAVEGLKVVTPAFDAYVVPLAVTILVTLFAVQSRGTASVAAFFGPVMFFWFAIIAAAGTWHIAQNMSVLLAFNPWYGISFLLHHGIVGFYTLGAVFLVVTGSRKPFTRILVILDGRRFASPGCLSSCRRFSSTIWGRARWCSPIQNR